MTGQVAEQVLLHVEADEAARRLESGLDHLPGARARLDGVHERDDGVEAEGGEVDRLRAAHAGGRGEEQVHVRLSGEAVREGVAGLAAHEAGAHHDAAVAPVADLEADVSRVGDALEEHLQLDPHRQRGQVEVHADESADAPRSAPLHHGSRSSGVFARPSMPRT